MPLAIAAPASAPGVPTCTTDPRFAAPLPDGRVLVIGEGLHGTEEAPAFVAAVLCAHLKAGKPVLLAWEHPRDRQGVLNAFMAGDGGAEAQRRLIDAVLGGPSGQDSLAILHLLDTVRQWRRAGARVAVSMVDLAETDLLEPLYAGDNKYRMSSPSQRQRLMAGVVETRARQYPDHAIVFFTAHAGRKATELGQGYESATLLLSRRLPVRVMAFRFEGGASWRCEGKTLPEVVCKAFEVQPQVANEDADDTVNLGIVHASPPASPNPYPIYSPPPEPSAKP